MYSGVILRGNIESLGEGVSSDLGVWGSRLHPGGGVETRTEVGSSGWGLSISTYFGQDPGRRKLTPRRSFPSAE